MVRRVSSRILVLGSAIAAVGTGLVVVQCGGGGRSTSGEPETPVGIEIERLRGELELARTTIAEADVDLERLRGELGRAQTDLAEETGRREQLEENFNEERLQWEEERRQWERRLNDERRGFEWLAFLVVPALILVGLVLWRELRWRNVLATMEATQPIRVVREGTTAVARRVTDVTPARSPGDSHGS